MPIRSASEAATARAASPAQRDFASLMTRAYATAGVRSNVPCTELVDRLTIKANDNDINSMLALGELHEVGMLHRTQIDYELAIAWYTKAANAGNESAMLKLGSLLCSGKVSGNQADQAKRDLTQALYWYRQYSVKQPHNGSAQIRALTDIPESLQDYHLLHIATPNFTARPEPYDESELKLIIEGLCQYEDNRLMPQDKRFERLKTIINEDEKYFDHMMTLMPVQEKDLFQKHLIVTGEELLRHKVILSIIGIAPGQRHVLVPELKTGSVHQQIRTENYVIMIVNLRIVMTEKANVQVQKHTMLSCLESIRGVLQYSPTDEALLDAERTLTDKLDLLKQAAVAQRKRDAEAPANSTNGSSAALESAPKTRRVG